MSSSSNVAAPAVPPRKAAVVAPFYVKYVIGGLAGMGATCVVQPLDLVKTRIQVGGKNEYKGTLDAIVKIVRADGLGVYKGLGAGLMRQATYTTGRMGVFTNLNEIYKKKFERNPNLIESMGMGAIAGAVGAVIGTPAEVVLIRMTADGRLPLAERRNYSGVFNALFRITREEGLLTLWRGCVPTVNRAIVVNMAQLSVYAQAKQGLVKYAGMKDGIGMHFVASMVSGFVTTLVSMPVDISKTRIQNMKPDAAGNVPYKSGLDVLVKVSRQEGIFALWKGFLPYFFRLGPHTVITFILLEQLNTFYKKNLLASN